MNKEFKKAYGAIDGPGMSVEHKIVATSGKSEETNQPHVVQSLDVLGRKPVDTHVPTRRAELDSEGRELFS